MAQKGLIAYEVAGTGYGAYESTTRIMQGCADWTDILSFSPLFGAAGRGARNANLRSQGKAKNTLKSGLSCSTSFVAGTEVLTPDGLVNIEDIEVGDWVISDDPNTPGDIQAKQVTRTFQRTDNNGIYDVSIGDEVISSTGNHDFWILDEKLVSADELQLGDWIITDNPDTPNVLESKQVLKSTLNNDGSFELQLDDEIVTVADKEEFWIKDEKWVQAQELEEGDLLQTEDGDFVTVEGIEVRDGSYEVFNFEVEDFHTYFVSQDGVLVHNTNCFEGPEYSSPIDPNFSGRPDPQRSIDTSTFKSGKSVTTTANGGLRDNKQFWKEWLKLNPDSIDSSNKYKIEKLGLSPRVNNQWIKKYPEHAKYKGQVIIHHHVDQGQYAIPVPAGSHVGSGGPFHYK